MSPLICEWVGEGHYEAAKGREVRWQPNRTLSMEVRCRQCPGCLFARRGYWMNAAGYEFTDAAMRGGRTWFVTLTYRPEERYRILLETRARVGEGFDRLSAKDKRRELAKTVGPWVTKMLKRLRYHVGKLRYLLVTEFHEDGFPHFHLLVHEWDELHPIRWADLSDQWRRYGNIVAKLCKDRGAGRYVGKYLSKDANTRIRASQHYGGEGASDEVEGPHERF